MRTPQRRCKYCGGPKLDASARTCELCRARVDRVRHTLGTTYHLVDPGERTLEEKKGEKEANQRRHADDAGDDEFLEGGGDVVAPGV